MLCQTRTKHNKAHMYKPHSQLNSSNLHIPSASSFYSLYDILSGSQSGILSLAFDLAFHLTFSLAFVLASWSHILIWHSVCVFLGSKSPAKPTAISRRKKVRRGPQRFSSRKSPARPTERVALQKSGETHGDQGTGRCSPARRQMKSGESHCNRELASDVRRGGGRRTSWHLKTQQPSPGTWGITLRIPLVARRQMTCYSMVMSGGQIIIKKHWV